MTTELITFKIEKNFLRQLDERVSNSNYQNRTEFIRSALREKIDAVEMKEAIVKLYRLKGASKKKTTDKELERLRKEAFAEYEKESEFFWQKRFADILK